MVHAKLAQIGVCLAAADKEDRLARDVCHRQSGADLVILDQSALRPVQPMMTGARRPHLGYERVLEAGLTHDRIKFSQDDPIYAPLSG